MKTSFWIRARPGSTLPSSATSVMPDALVSVLAPTIAGTCIFRPALTRRTSTLPVTVVPAVTPERRLTGYSDAAALVVSNERPLIR